MLGKDVKSSQVFLKFKTDKERMAHLKKLIREQKTKMLADRAKTQAALKSAKKELRDKKTALSKANALVKKQKGKLKAAGAAMKKKEAQMKKRISADKARMETLKANTARKIIEQKKT